MGGQPGNLPHTQWWEIAMPDTFQALRRLCAPCLALSDYFFTVSLAHTLLSFTLYIPPSLTCTRAARRRLTAADDFHDAQFFQLFVTHTHTLARARK